MSLFWKIILIGSILLNMVAVWGLFHYIMYGGNPLLEIKRKLVGAPTAPTGVNPIAESNARIRQEIEAGQTDSLRVVFFGASITHSWDLDRYFPEIHAVNRGVGGFASELLMKFKANVIDLKPRAVVIKLCSINIRPTIPSEDLRHSMEMMVQLSQANDIEPVVATMIPSAKAAAHIADFSVTKAIDEFNQWIRDYARANGLVLIDLAAAISDDEGFLPRDCSIDPVHVNDKGYDILSETARPILYDLIGVNQNR